MQTVWIVRYLIVTSLVLQSSENVTKENTMALPMPAPWPESAKLIPLHLPARSHTVVFSEGALTVNRWGEEQTVTLRVFCERSHCHGCGCDTDHLITLDAGTAQRILEALHDND